MSVAQVVMSPLVRCRSLSVEALCRAGLGLAIGVYLLTLLRLAFGLYDRLGMMAFDLGIFDQAVWLISRGQTPFVTVRGLHILADHFSAILYLIAPLYWVWSSPRMLLLAQTIALALGAIPVYALARDRTKSAPTALLFAVVYLLYPALQWSNTYEFHPDTLATPLLLGAFYFLTQQQWRWYFWMLAIAALTKETVGLSIFCLGIYALFIHRRAGCLTLALGTTALAAAMETVRYFNHGAPSAYIWLYARYGNTPLAIASYLARHPFAVAAGLNNEAHRQYFLQLLQPVLFLPLAAPEVFLLTAPALMLNLLSSRPWMHGIEDYYTALVTPFIIVAAVIGYDRIRRRSGPFVRSALLINLALWSLAGTLWGPLWRDSHTLYSTLSPGEAAEIRSLLASIPATASVSAPMALVPQVSQRSLIYTFPNPFVKIGWGGTLRARQEIESVNRAKLPPEAELDEAMATAAVDYIAICPSTSPFPLSRENFTTCALTVLGSPSYGIVAIDRSAILLRRGADHRRGLRLLQAQSGWRIAGGERLADAYWRWLARQSSETTPTTRPGPPSPARPAGRLASGSAVEVLTQHNDNARTGANLNETILNVANVNVRQFGKLLTRRVDGHIYAQPLYMPNRMIPGKGVHNLVFVATMHNSVYAFDADSPEASEPLWHVNLGPSVPIEEVESIPDIAFEVGILSTPVIDPRTNTLYVVSKTKRSSGFFSASGCYEQRLHALDVTTGAEKFGGPVLIRASVPGSGDGGDTITFGAKCENQRPALLLTDGVVYISWASHSGDGLYHGWVIGYDAATLRQRAAYVDTPDGEKGGIWQSGQGPAADGRGNIFLATGNGSFDGDSGGPDLGSCILKMRTTRAGLKVVDWFAPHDVGALNAADMELSSSGPLLIPGTHLLLNGSKSGTLYLLDRDRLGRFHAGDDRHCLQALKVSARHIQGSPICWRDPNQHTLVYVWGGQDYLRAFRLSGNALQEPPMHQSRMKAPRGEPGGILSLSANASTPGTGIVWASLPYRGDASHRVVPGILRAFDASDVSRELWNSKQDAARDDVGSFAKFCPPTIANGKVYLATFSCQLVVYGLLNR